VARLWLHACEQGRRYPQPASLLGAPEYPAHRQIHRARPLTTFEQKLILSGRQVPKRTYILAAGWEPSPFQQFGARFKDDRGWQFVSIPCGHDVMVDRPQELADVLASRILASSSPTTPRSGPR